MLAFAAAFGAGVFLAALGLGALVHECARARRAFGTRRRTTFPDLSGALQKWVARAEKEMRLGFLRRRGPGFLGGTVAAAALGFWGGLALFKTPASAALAAMIAGLLPEQVLHYREQMRREKLLEQMGAAVRMFAAEYSETPHPVQALGLAARKLPDPIGGVLRQAERDLLTRERDDALLRLGRELDSEYGRMFVQLLRLSFEDEAVKPLFARLALRLTEQQGLVRKNRVQVAADRLGSMALSLGAVPVYFLMLRALPESGEFFVGTVAGRMLVCLCLVSILGSMLMDRLMGGVDLD